MLVEYKCEIKEVFGAWSSTENREESSPVSCSLYTYRMDMLRIAAALKTPVPRMAGHLRVLTKHNPPEAIHQVEFLPFIDLSPADMSSVYTALLFVIEQCRKQGQQAIIYFDQPLWWTAMMIKEAKDLQITIMIGNFHFQMCFLASIGFIMKNTGLEAILGVIYGDNTVKKIMSGKSYKRSMRAHSLLSTVLKKILLEQVTKNTVCSNKSILRFSS